MRRYTLLAHVLRYVRRWRWGTRILARHHRRLAPFLPAEHRLYETDGGPLYLDISESPMMFARAVGERDRKVLSLMRQVLGDGGVAIDIGANKGEYALMASRLVGDRGRVHAFEPEPLNAYWLERSIAVNGITNCHLYQMALGACDGEASLYLGEKSGWHSLRHDAPGRQGGHVSVTLRTLDSLRREIGLDRVDFLKIDVEGEEVNVLEGARGTLAASPRITAVVDVHPHLGVDPVSVAAILESCGCTLCDKAGMPSGRSAVDTRTETIIGRKFEGV